MAETLRNGVVVPQRQDRISSSGVDEMRNLGASVAAGLGAAAATAEAAKSLAATVDAQAKSRDTALEAQIAGMEGMRYVGAWAPGTTYRINDVVTHGGDSWARLTAGSTGEPGVSPADWGLVARKGDGGGFGRLVETATTGLYEPVPDPGPGYNSGERDITSLVTGRASGALHLWRLGSTVWLDFRDLVCTDPVPPQTWHSWTGLLPSGFRPVRSWVYAPLAPVTSTRTVGPVRIGADGGVVVYNVTGQKVMTGLISFPTPNAAPTSLPGSTP